MSESAWECTSASSSMGLPAWMSTAGISTQDSTWVLISGMQAGVLCHLYISDNRNIKQEMAKEWLYLEDAVQGVES